MGLALGCATQHGHRHQAVHRRVPARSASCWRRRRPTAVNLFWAIERMKRAFCRRRASRRVGRPDQGAAATAKPIAFTTRTSRAAAAIGAHGAALVPDEARDPHALQRRRAGHRRLRHGARRDSRPRSKPGRRSRARRRDAPVPAGRAAHRLGADARTASTRPSSPTTWPARSCRPGEIDLVVVGADRIAANGDTANKIGTYTRGGARAGARHPVLRGGAVVDDRSVDAGRRRDPDRGADVARGHARRQHPARARRRARAATRPST